MEIDFSFCQAGQNPLKTSTDYEKTLVKVFANHEP